MPRAQLESFPQVHLEPCRLRLRQHWIHVVCPILVLLVPAEVPVPWELFHPENRQPTLNAGIVGFQLGNLMSWNKAVW